MARKGQAQWEKKLLKSRDKAVKAALQATIGHKLSDVVGIFSKSLDESYLKGFYKQLYTDVGLRCGEDALKSFNKKYGTKSGDNWEGQVLAYVNKYTGKRIKLVSGTLKAELIGWLKDAAIAAPEMGVEAVTKEIYQDILAHWDDVKMWQVRRIVQTEMMSALGAGQDAAVRSLGIDFVKQWTATFNNTREQHAEMDGVTVDRDEYFVLPNGDQMMYPADFSMGASAENLINCSCGVFNIPKV